MAAEKLFSDNHGELRHELALCTESKVIFTLCEPTGAILVTPLKLLMNNFPNLTGCRLPRLLLEIDDMITWIGPV
jgi:hypothetical protein